jgi:hypothetical protein
MALEDEKFPDRLKGKGVVHFTARDDSSPELITLRNVLRAWHWKGYKRVLDIAVVISPTERAWEVVRSQIMDTAAEQERELEVLIARLLPKAKEEEEKKA